MRRTFLTISLLAALVFVFLPQSMTMAAQLQRHIPAKVEQPSLQTMAPSGLIIVKFLDESGLEVHQSGLRGGTEADRHRVQNLMQNQMADKATSVPLQRRFDQDPATLDLLRQRGQQRVRQTLPNLNAYGVLDYSAFADDRPLLLSLMKTLLADPTVETVFLEPRSVPASLGFDAFTGTYTAPEIEGPALDKNGLRDTPDFTSYQGYLLAPPGGVNAMAVADIPGGRGQGMKMVDIELGWNITHEDLPEPFFTAGNISSTLDNRNHGTAVLGEIRGIDNGFGVRGIAPDVEIGVSSAFSNSVSNALMFAWQAVDQGDVLLIELHAPGPNADGNGQFGYVPMEYWQDNFDVIMHITANGGVVVEAAGNGTQDLDDAVYGPLFDRNYRDSGAIMCGATTISGTPYGWSNHGSRVDLNGWGGNVGTCGYGDLQGSPGYPEDEFYTGYFSGTSSASPIVTGSVISLQAMAKATYGFILDALTIREIMAETGTPQNPGGIVGPRPDILAAFQQLQWGLGEISGTVTDAATGMPISGVEVTVTGSNHAVTTDDEGNYFMITDIGTRQLVFRQFFYQEATGTQEVVFDTPAVLDIALTSKPAVDIRVMVRGDDGTALTSGQVTCLDHPLITETLPGNDGFILRGAPLDIPVRLVVGSVPFYGVDVVDLTPTHSASGYNFFYPELATADFDFELWWYNFYSQGDNWVWGIPSPSATGNPAPFSGEKCWGIGMDSDYPDNTNDYLSLDNQILAGNEETYLALHYFCDLEDGVDGVNLQIKSFNNTWVDLEPLNGYSHDNIPILGNKPGWSGQSDGWQPAVFDIQEYTNLPVYIRFKFVSNNEVSGAGFFIDDVTIDNGDSVSPVDLDPVLPTPQVMSLRAHPNPFNPQTTIDWAITRSSHVSVKVYDTRGRLVRNLLDVHTSATSGTLVWDGKDTHGQTAASGTYLVRVQDGTGQSRTRSVTLLK